MKDDSMNPDSDTNIVAVELRDIRFTYDAGATWALDGVNLTIRQGERVCLAGPNGSGKSTLSRIIAGLAAPDAGHVTLLGNNVFDESGAHADAYRSARHGIGAVFQHPEDQIVTTITEDDVAFGPENLAIAHDDIDMRIAMSLDAVDMSGQREADPTRMSGGQQQRVAIAGMLAMNPEILVLDEPTAMLDPQGRADIMHILDELQQHGTTIILVTHHRDEFVNADRIIRLDSGRIVQSAHSDAASIPEMDESDTAQEDNPIAKSNIANGASKPASAVPIIEIRNLTYQYPNSNKPVLDKLSITINAGETVAITGHNGAGKTTLARLLCALDQPQAGNITINTIPVARQRTNGNMQSLKRADREKLHATIGYVMQHPERQLFAETVAEDIAYGPRNQHLDETQVSERVNQAMTLLHIEHLADRSPFDLSGGQQRLAAIAGVIACQPQILIMDEPTAGLDEAATTRVHDLIQTLHAQGVTVLIISHSQTEIDVLADRVIALDRRQNGNVATRNIEANGTSETAGSKNPHAIDSGRAKGDVRENRSFMERLDPRVKMVSALAIMFSAFAIRSFWQLLVAALLTGMIVAISGIGVKQLFKSVHVFLALFVFCGLLNIFFVRSGNVLTNIGPIPITDDGVRIAILYACRFVVVIIVGAVFLATTTPTAITDAFEALLKPFAKFGIHAQEIALVMSLALRFLPTLGSEAKAIVDAQSARGGSIETGTFVQRIKAITAIIIPVFAGAIRHADNLSLALDARCYEEGIMRTHWRIMRIAKHDIAVVGVSVSYIAALTLIAGLC
ncbi:energy-coupling factor transporter ATPase [Bifidobacterium catenulatum]|uniref:energy-coupling factor transporter ATPase n=1 Tax=Bifidobacterium catenulatum TaxID=1686 RepID=UPI00232E55A7|nr:energy-coupling factor transporter ATPase [Bifidobacterium catenulatum]MDB1140869.1 energy-coupling factor transporter ATPase [Bifidobacterium catenulatum]MDB1146800.1 energy-coupling factor transporter ATPase [Bifidobacterium catenulatum]MDB1158696.1 energy-coupling factor transporter ATPase [Bifidobacterium catenulatum]